MAELNKQASTREAPATSVVVAPPPKLTAPPRVKEQTEIDSKVAEVSQASDAAAAVAASFTTSCSPPSPATTTSMPPPPSPPPHLTSSTSTSRRCTRPP